MAQPLTVEAFIDHFRKSTGWKCEPGSQITKHLTEFATERSGSTRNIDELHVIFCTSKGIRPYAAPTPSTGGEGQ